VTRVLISEPPYADGRPGNAWNRRSLWPCRWIELPEAAAPLRTPFVAGYRLRFTVEAAMRVRIHVSADERYELFLDWERIGRGPERGDAQNWFFETFDLAFEPGQHVIAARVWSLGGDAPFAQHSVRHGFLLSPEGEAAIALLGTGVAAGWEAKALPGYEFLPSLAAWGTGANTRIDGALYDHGWESGAGSGADWALAAAGPVATSKTGAPNDYDAATTHLLTPATLPAQRDVRWEGAAVRLVADPGGAGGDQTNPIPIRMADHLAGEAKAWSRLLADGVALTVPPNTRRRVLIDLGNYACAHTHVTTDGGRGGRVRVDWAEGLYEEHKPAGKGNRDEIEGKFFVNHWYNLDGIGDEFLPGGVGDRPEAYSALWWQCGRYVELLVETADAPLTLRSIVFQETRYPLERTSRFEASDPRLEAVSPLQVRALQMCSHETYMDCPYYEQLQYIGDTRLEVLTTYVVTADDALPRKALRMFDASRQPSGLTYSRYPSRVVQIIPPFSLWWVGMVHDFALWRSDPAFVGSLLPGVRGVVDAFLSYRNDDGLVQAPPGWNYVDWVRDFGDTVNANKWDAAHWQHGMPSGADTGVSGVLNWQTTLALTYAAALEEYVGEPELATRCRRSFHDLAARLTERFWVPERGLFTDDVARSQFSEHTQCLALLSGLLPAEQAARVGEALTTAPDLARTTIYFTHYLFEAYRTLRRPDLFLDRMGLWFDLAANGLRTTIEQPEPTRSDCHAWGAHPLYHYAASILGIRPAAPGFQVVEVAPQLGALEHASGTVPHPAGGEIAVTARRTGPGAVSVAVTLPAGVSGRLVGADGAAVELAPGGTTEATVAG
jgi:hypothetical protein